MRRSIDNRDMRHYLIALAMLCFLLAGLTSPSFAAGQVQTEHTTVELLSEASGAPRSGDGWVAVRIILDQGWHTYWQNPGDSGGPVELEWSLPAGVRAGEISWPYPERLAYGHLMNFGMEDDVWLLVPLYYEGISPDVDTIELSVHVSMLVCEVQCVPEDADVDLRLNIAKDQPVITSVRAAQFEKVRQKHPKQSLWPAEVWQQTDRLLFRLDMPGVDGGMIRKVTVFPTEDGWIKNAAIQRFRYQDDALYVETEIGHSGAERLERGARFDAVVVIDESLPEGMVVQPLSVTAKTARPAPIINLFPTISILEAIIYAMIGGIILNAMPCVFPVLSIKILTLVREASGETHQMRKQGLVYGLSVVVGFLAIGGLFLALRGLGEAVGWGFQLQSPPVVLLLGYVMFAVSLSLLGVFDFGLGFAMPQSSSDTVGGTRGSMLTGLLAVVVASPCTAPFMVAAMGFALFEPTLVALVIFASLGIGMAIPYVMLAFWPKLLSRLPKPGPWMERLKQFLAVPMLATVGWLYWVLTLQSGVRALVIAMSGLVFIALGAWLLQRRSASDGRGRIGFSIAAAAAAIIAVGAAVDDSFRVRPPTGGGLDFVSPIPSVPWSESALQALREDGTPVFLNFTASWCITCLLNEQVALSSESVQAAFEKASITYMKADWTSRDDEIAEALRSYGRSGVPLYIYFGPDGAQGRILPQLLTEGIILDHIK